MSDPRELEQLCLDCGMCCGSALFERIELTVEERSADSARHLSVLDEAGHGALPCVHHVAGQCQIYAQRFTACRDFVCKTYNDVRNGKVDIDAAHATVREFQRSVRELESLLGWSPGSYSAAAFRDWCTQHPDGETSLMRSHPLVFLKLGVVRVLAEKYFVGPRR